MDAEPGIASRRALLVCGILSSLLYVGIDVAAAVRFGGYHSFASQTLSELSAVGAPTKQLVDPPFVLYDLLLIAFGIGVWITTQGARRLRIVAGVLIAIGVIGLPGAWLYPMHVRGSGNVRGDLPHILVFSVISLMIMVSVACGAFALGRWFRVFSLAVLSTMLVSGALTAFAARGIAAGGPTPWIGLTERLDVGAYLLWVAVLAVALLRALSRAATRQGGSFAARATEPAA